MSPFAGREAELAELRAVVSGAGTSKIAVVTADAGAGKSRLLREAAGRYADSGATVLVGGCLPLSAPMPLLPVAEWMRDLSRPPLQQRWATALEHLHPVLVSELGALVPKSAGPSTSADPPAGRDPGLLFSAVREALDALSSMTPLCLVVEDLHWADSGSLDLLTYLVRTRRDATWSLLVTSRSAELDPTHPTLRWLAETARLPEVLTLPLKPLLPHDVRKLVSDLSTTTPSELFVTDVVTRSAGNPFFVEQLVATGSDGAPAARLPESVVSLLRSRLVDLAPSAAAVVRVLAVAGHDLTGAELVACLGAQVGTDPAVEALQDLVVRHLVVDDGDAGYRLVHALLGEVVTADLTSVQRQDTHRAVARALVASGGVHRAAEIAGHFAASGDQAEELPWALVAADQAERLYAWRESARLWTRSLEIWDEPLAAGVTLTFGDVAVRASDCFDHLGATGPGEETVTAALADPRVAADPFSRARLLTRLARFRGPVDVSARASLVAEAVALFATLPPSGEAAKAMLWDAESASEDGRHDLPADRLHAALETARLTGAVDAQVRIGTVLATWETEEGRPEQAARRLRAAWALAQERGMFESNPASMLVDLLIGLAQFEEAVAVGRRDVAEKEAFDLLFGHVGQLAVANLTEALLWLGRTDDARAALARLPDVPLSPESWTTVDLGIHVAVRSGDLDAAQRQVGELAALDMAWPEFFRYLATTQAEVHHWSGQPLAAWTTARAELRRRVGSRVGENAAELLGVAARAAADTGLAQRLDETARDQMSQELTQLAEGCRAFRPHPSRRLAQLERLGYDAEVARLRGSATAAHWQLVGDSWCDVGARHREAYARLRLAECLLDLRRPAAAAPALSAAVRLAAGHVPLATEALALARRASVRLSTEPDPALPNTAAAPPDEYGLTSRERAVLELLVDGLTNTQIGGRLYMSPKTASVHVSSILRKLGVANRLQAATLAERSGLLPGRG
jgi:DNA-binding CsgD family transcriptional regulator